MKIFKYILLVSVFLFSFGSKPFLKEKQTPPYYQLEAQGLNRRIVNENSDFSYSAYIEKQVDRFISRWEMKGISIAVVKDDQLVYARGFGVADDQGTPVQPGHIFRLASVSKLITAVAIMKLVEEKKLSLDDTVFGPDGIIKDTVFNDVRDKKIYNITVRDLLTHAGGWTQGYGDPAFYSLSIAQKVGDPAPATIESYYKYIASRRLSFPPGTRVSYSNMGYMFLGAVISTVSGQSYESFVQDKILVPNGIIDMHIGNSYSTKRYPNEVQYYEQEGSLQIKEYTGSGKLVDKSDGGNPIELLSSAGGWVSSSVEFARLVTLIDGIPEVNDILTNASIETMTDNTYAKGPLGWKTTVKGGNWTRTGSMAGTSAMVKRMSNGLTWVFIANSSTWKGSMFPTDINSLMQRIISHVDEWPDRDLFNYYPIDSLPLALADLGVK